MSPRSKGRAGRPWRRVWNRLRNSPGSDVCWLCGHMIDKTLPARHPMSWTADHVDPISLGGAERDIRLLRPAHMRCNSKRGNRTGAAGRPMRTSEAW
ncbi:HNH endonuclease [Streptosporangium sp. CA-115845]|uniref:HNH endonuclease n=1 Tax=Streptosporangium sp. CA-115845 TaxID=3240071 RepID=UPI003D89DA21